VKYDIEWAELCTKDLIKATWSRVICANDEGSDAHYHNPEYSVFAPAGSDLEYFVRQACRAQVLWHKRLVRVFGRKAKRGMSRDEPLKTRAIFFTGLLIIEGQIVHPAAWPDVVQAEGKRADNSSK